MKIFKLIKILIDDKKYQSENRNERVTQINHLLELSKISQTEKLHTAKGNDYIATYNRGLFWYDNTPITLKNLLNRLGYYHVQHWLVYPNSKSKCGFGTSIIDARFSKKKIYSWLESQSRIMDNILSQ